MLVRVYDFITEDKPKFADNLVGIIDDVVSFKYTRRAYDIGSFELTIPKNANDAYTIIPDRMIVVGDNTRYSYIVGTTKKTISGNALYVTEVKSDDEYINVTGYDLKYLLSFRVTLFPAEEQDKGTYGYYVTNGTTYDCIADLIDYNVAQSTDTDRQIYGMSRLTMLTAQKEAGLTGIQDDRYMTRLEPLTTAIFNLLKNCKTHFYEVKLLIDDDKNSPDGYNPHMESGEDKPTIVISEDKYNIRAYTKTDDTSAYKNAIYAVAGNSSDVDTVVKLVKRSGDTAAGVNRKEVVVDVDTDSVSEIDRYALRAAEEYTISDDFEIEPLFHEEFEDEPTLAQKVCIKIGNAVYETIITEITDEYTPSGHKVTYSTGNKKVKVLNVLNRAVAGNTQKIINNKIDMSNIEAGVGKFTNSAKTAEIFNDYSGNTASGDYAHAEGFETAAGGDYSHAEGWGTLAKSVSHAEGEDTSADKCSHAEGRQANATGEYCHAEGYETRATGIVSHAEGQRSASSGWASHAEGFETAAGGDYSHAEGYNTISQQNAAHAEGYETRAGGAYSHAQNKGTVAQYDSNTAMGKYNEKGKNLALAVGNGTSDTARSNALELDWNGNLHIAGRMLADGGVEIDLSEYLRSDEIADWAKSATKPEYTAYEVGAAAEQHTHITADITDFPAIPTKVSELQNDSGYISEETDPTVPAWAKSDTKPIYTASEVGAAAAEHTHTVNDITNMPDWVKSEEKPTYTAAEVGAAAESHTHAKSQITDLVASEADFDLASRIILVKVRDNADRITANAESIAANTESIAAAVAEYHSEFAVEEKTVSLSNSASYPFNNSKTTVALSPARVTQNYTVSTEVTLSDGNVGEVEITDKQLNGFKVAFTGSAKSVTLKIKIRGGIIA